MRFLRKERTAQRKVTRASTPAENPAKHESRFAKPGYLPPPGHEEAHEHGGRGRCGAEAPPTTPRQWGGGRRLRCIPLDDGAVRKAAPEDIKRAANGDVDAPAAQGIDEGAVLEAARAARIGDGNGAPPAERHDEVALDAAPVSYTHLTLPTT